MFPTPLNNTYFVVLYVIQQPAQCMLCKGNTNDLLLFASIGDKITGTSTTQCVSQQQFLGRQSCVGVLLPLNLSYCYGPSCLPATLGRKTEQQTLQEPRGDIFQEPEIFKNSKLRYYSYCRGHWFTYNSRQSCVGVLLPLNLSYPATVHCSTEPSY